MYYARTLKTTLDGVQNPPKQLLEDHLTQAAKRAEKKLTEAFSARDGYLGYVAGLFHDVGKYQQAFQDMLVGAVNQGVSHAPVGAALFESGWVENLNTDNELLYTFSKCLSRLMSTVVANHHRGLVNYSGDYPSTTQNRIEKGKESLGEILDLAPPLPQLGEDVELPSLRFLDKGTRGEYRIVGGTNNEEEIHLAFAWYTRFLYSALVDADVEDAIAFERPGYQKQLDNLTYAGFAELQAKLDQYMAKLNKASRRTKVNKLRKQLWPECLPSADGPPGFYSLSAPVGAGKTLLSAAWALRHIRKNRLRRLIYIMPYSSIIAQNADVYREVFGADNVTEHQYNIDPSENTFKNRSAVPNWSSPVVLTTMVQFFESLRESAGHRLRKLHAIPNSVIILDEFQVLDPALLLPTLQTLWRLRSMGCSILFMTATQPALKFNPTLLPEGLPLSDDTELVPEPQKYIDAMRRVRVDWDFARKSLDVMESRNTDTEDKWKWLGGKFKKHRQVLVVSSTRNTAKKIYEQLPPRNRYHLSTRMCSAHRVDKLKEIRGKLKADEIIRVSTTQLVEAGVSLDFPSGYRMMAGVDSLVQVSGRINREGKRKRRGKGRLGGTLRPFYAPAKPPPGLLRVAADVTDQMLRTDPIWELDIFNLDVQQKFFEEVYSRIDPDKNEVLDYEKDFMFAEVAWRAKMIKNTHMVDVVVPYGAKGCKIVKYLESGDEMPYPLARDIQRYTVSIYPQDYSKLEGLLVPGKKNTKWAKKNEESGVDLYFMPEENALYFYDDNLGVLVPEDMDPIFVR